LGDYNKKKSWIRAIKREISDKKRENRARKFQKASYLVFIHFTKTIKQKPLGC
jgi:hypothetical protein